jgi:hypothetical protein
MNTPILTPIDANFSSVSIDDKLVGYLKWINLSTDITFISQLVSVINLYEQDENNFWSRIHQVENWGNGWSWLETRVTGANCPRVSVLSNAAWHTGNPSIQQFNVRSDGLYLKETFLNRSPISRAY